MEGGAALLRGAHFRGIEAEEVPAAIKMALRYTRQLGRRDESPYNGVALSDLGYRTMFRARIGKLADEGCGFDKHR